MFFHEKAFLLFMYLNFKPWIRIWIQNAKWYIGKQQQHNKFELASSPGVDGFVCGGEDEIRIGSYRRYILNTRYFM